MKPDKAAPETVDEYIAAFPEDVREILEKIRQTIREAAPGAEETISYQMPTFKQNGSYVVYFGAFKKHLGLYPTPDGIEAFKDELAPYKNAKGSVQFPLDKPMPYDLISRIVKYRVKENLVRADKTNLRP